MGEKNNRSLPAKTHKFYSLIFKVNAARIFPQAAFTFKIHLNIKIPEIYLYVLTYFVVYVIFLIL